MRSVVQARPLGDAVLPVLAPACVLAAWWWVSATGRVPREIVPAPQEVWATAVGLANNGTLLEAATATLQRLGLGGMAGGLLGVAGGAGIAGHRLLDRYCGPALFALMQLPGIIWVPLLIALLGIGEAFKVVGIALTVFFPVASASYEAVRAVPRGFIELAAALRLPPLTTLWRIQLPAILPQLVAGLRIGLSKGWLVVVFVELFAASSGLGYLMDEGRTTFHLDVVLVAAVTSGLLGYAMDRALACTGQHLLRASPR